MHLVSCIETSFYIHVQTEYRKYTAVFSKYIHSNELQEVKSKILNLKLTHITT